MKLTPFAKVFITAVVLLTVGAILAVRYDLVGARRGATAQRGTNLPPRVALARCRACVRLSAVAGVCLGVRCCWGTT